MAEMNLRELWQAVYIAAIHSHGSTDRATYCADEAVERYLVRKNSGLI